MNKFIFSLFVLLLLPSIAFCRIDAPIITNASSAKDSVTLTFSDSTKSGGWWRISYGTSYKTLIKRYDKLPTTNPSSGTITGLTPNTTYYFKVTFFISGTSQRANSAVLAVKTASNDPTPTP
jgi:hypothetical protein